MPSYVIRHLDRAIIEQAGARARETGRGLADVVREWLIAYAAGQLSSAESGAKGGHARASTLTAQERSESARKAVAARWAGHRKHVTEKKESAS